MRGLKCDDPRSVGTENRGGADERSARWKRAMIRRRRDRRRRSGRCADGVLKDGVQRICARKQMRTLMQRRTREKERIAAIVPDLPWRREGFLGSRSRGQQSGNEGEKERFQRLNVSA